MTYTPAQHAEMEGQPPFELADEVVLASGLKLAGTRARIYSLLRRSAERGERHRIGLHVGPAGWVPNYYLRKGWSGGNAGDRRLRDLRERGVRIETTRFSEDSAVVLYRWIGDPDPSGSNRFPDSSKKTRPISSGDFSGGFSDEARSDEPAATPKPSHVRFWTCVGFPGADAPRLDVANGSHPLSLPRQLVRNVVAGSLREADALAIYDNALRRRWPELREWLEACGEHVLWLEAAVAETLNPLPLLVEILGKCGAEYLGDWQQRRKEIA